MLPCGTPHWAYQLAYMPRICGTPTLLTLIFSSDCLYRPSADYYLAVVQGAVPRVAYRKGLGSSATLPHPDELADLWTGLGARWLQQQLAGAGGRCGGGGADPWVDALDRDHVTGRQDSEVSGTWQAMDLMAFERVQGMCTVSEGEEGEELEDEEEGGQERLQVRAGCTGPRRVDQDHVQVCGTGMAGQLLRQTVCYVAFKVAD